MSALGDLIAEYESGRTDWLTFRQRLLDWPYAGKPSLVIPDDATVGDTYAAVYNRSEDMEYPYPGTFEEVTAACDRGVLTSAQYLEILAAIRT